MEGKRETETETQRETERFDFYLLCSTMYSIQWRFCIIYDLLADTIHSKRQRLKTPCILNPERQRLKTSHILNSERQRLSLRMLFTNISGTIRLPPY